MTYTETKIPGVWILEPKVWKDARGYFMEAFKQTYFEEHIGKIQFIQDNESCSSKGVLRGLHYQLAPYSQAKLVRVIKGRVLDVAVDIRSGSPTFGQYVAVELSDESILEMKSSNARDYYASEKAHRAFTLGKIHPKATTASSLITSIRFIYLILLTALTLLSAYDFLQQPDYWIVPAISVGTAILIYLTETLIYISAIRKIAGILHAPKQFFTTPVFRLTRPFANAYFRSKSAQADNYTWE